MNLQLKKCRLMLLALGMVAFASEVARAEVCFTGFNGGVHYQLQTTVNQLKTPGTKLISGRIFGSLSPCAGLNEWPLIVSSIKKNNSSLILAFRSMTVDTTGCGAVDNIVNLNPSTLSGPLQLHNDRNNFSNTTTLVSAPCIEPSSVSTSQRNTTMDSFGNKTP